LIVHLYAEVTRSIVGRHLPRAAGRNEILPNEFILPDLIGPGNFDRAIKRLRKGDICHRRSEIIRNDGLHEDGR
jgi:hypothetical protein